ncbi:MAG: hypothetical protein IPI77_11980 [Saprospiraceae bacterium]|nr:hypothetical protein [Saprospiraceae bacterium]
MIFSSCRPGGQGRWLEWHQFNIIEIAFFFGQSDFSWHKDIFQKLTTAVLSPYSHDREKTRPIHL